MRIAELLQQMEELNASDLFLHVGKAPRVRVFGALRELDGVPETTADDFETFFGERLRPPLLATLERQRDLDVGISLTETCRFRLNVLFQKGQLGCVVRRVPSGALGFSDLGLPCVVRELAELPRGLVLITGSTGSGKSSTMAAMLHHINSTARRHIVTIEDPIEFLHRDEKSMVTQREVGSDTLSYAEALRHVVRQSPDVIFLGELRDLDTIQTALSAAMTGHLVITTMHTVDTTQTLERIVNHFPDHLRNQVAVDLSLALAGIIAQRLLPRKDGSGLTPVFEILRATPLACRHISHRQLEAIPDVLKTGDSGMTTFTRSLVERFREGAISLATGSDAATNKDAFLMAIQGMETGVESLRGGDPGGPSRELTMKSLLKAAIKHGASDLILSVGCPPMLRLNGSLREIRMAPLTAGDTQRLLFSLLTPGQRARFEETREIDFALSVSGIPGADLPELENHRFRVNGFYQRGTVASALRVIPQRIPAPDELRIPQTLLKLATRHQGLILVTGPTGHGKSTTLACLVEQINRSRGCHIITVEDPIEYVHTNQRSVIEQREVNADTRSFADALKYVLRQDPDVILIGELRDQETMSAALTAAETGHLVMGTLHTNDAVQTVDRIIDSFPAHQQNQVRMQCAASLLAVVAQRLVPRRDRETRVAAFEILLGTTAVRSLIRDNRTHQLLSTMETAAKDGMVTLDRALSNLYDQNLISRETLASLVRHG